MCVHVPQKPLDGCLGSGNPTSCFMGQPEGLEEGSGQHSLGERGSDSLERRSSLLPVLILPRPVYTCPCPFYPTQCSLFSASSAHQTDTGQLLGLLFSHSILLCQDLLLPPPEDETEPENLPPLFFPLPRNGIWTRTSEMLA